MLQPINWLNLIAKRPGGPPPILSDGNTLAWLDMALRYIIKDGSDFVSQWTDRSGQDNHLPQAIGTNQPLWSSDGVLFDGVDNFMKAVGFTYGQPEQIYIVLKQVTWTISEFVMDGSAGGQRGILYQRTATPGLMVFAGIDSSLNNNLAIGAFGIIRILFNGASSKFQINETAAITADFGSNDMDGFTLGANFVPGNYSNIEVKEIILRDIDDTDANEQEIYDYLAEKYSI